MATSTTISQPCIDIVLQMAACHISDRSIEIANRFKYGVGCKKERRKLFIATAWIEMITKYTAGNTVADGNCFTEDQLRKMLDQLLIWLELCWPEDCEVEIETDPCDDALVTDNGELIDLGDYTLSAPCVISGCTDPLADNYAGNTPIGWNYTVTDDGSCIYSSWECTSGSCHQLNDDSGPYDDEAQCLADGCGTPNTITGCVDHLAPGMIGDSCAATTPTAHDPNCCIYPCECCDDPAAVDYDPSCDPLTCNIACNYIANVCDCCVLINCGAANIHAGPWGTPSGFRGDIVSFELDLTDQYSSQTTYIGVSPIDWDTNNNMGSWSNSQTDNDWTADNQGFNDIACTNNKLWIMDINGEDGASNKNLKEWDITGWQPFTVTAPSTWPSIGNSTVQSGPFVGHYNYSIGGSVYTGQTNTSATQYKFIKLGNHYTPDRPNPYLGSTSHGGPTTSIRKVGDNGLHAINDTTVVSILGSVQDVEEVKRMIEGQLTTVGHRRQAWVVEMDVSPSTLQSRMSAGVHNGTPELDLKFDLSKALADYGSQNGPTGLPVDGDGDIFAFHKTYGDYILIDEGGITYMYVLFQGIEGKDLVHACAKFTYGDATFSYCKHGNDSHTDAATCTAAHANGWIEKTGGDGVCVAYHSFMTGDQYNDPSEEYNHDEVWTGPGGNTTTYQHGNAGKSVNPFKRGLGLFVANGSLYLISKFNQVWEINKATCKPIGPAPVAFIPGFKSYKTTSVQMWTGQGATQKPTCFESNS